MLEGEEYQQTIDLTGDILTYKGSKPSSGTLVIGENGKMRIIAKYGKYCIEKNDNDKSPKVVEERVCNGEIVSNKVYTNGTAIYYNPETNQTCSKEEAENNLNENGVPTGIKSGCMKWYAYNDNEQHATVNMILDHNTTPLVAWSSEGNTEMKEVLEALEYDTSTWINGLNPRLITADEVAQISGNTLNWASEYMFYFGSNNGEDNSLNGNYAWLYNNLWLSIKYHGVAEDNNLYIYDSNLSPKHTYGYWTATPDTRKSYTAWYVHRDGYLDCCGSRVEEYYYGVRPVITVSKTVLN